MSARATMRWLPPPSSCAPTRERERCTSGCRPATSAPTRLAVGGCEWPDTLTSGQLLHVAAQPCATHEGCRRPTDRHRQERPHDQGAEEAGAAEELPGRPAVRRRPAGACLGPPPGGGGDAPALCLPLATAVQRLRVAVPPLRRLLVGRDPVVGVVALQMRRYACRRCRRREHHAGGPELTAAPGWWVPQPGGQAVLGEDLLWTGSFEDMDLDPGTQGAHGWTLGGDVEHTPRASCASESGVELRRAPLSPQNVVLAPAHRQLLPRGESLRVTLFADVRRATAGGSLELALFQDTRGGSFTSHRVPVPVGEHDVDACQRVRLDVAVPPGVVAMQPFVRLSPHPDNVRSSHLGVDNVRLVAWAAPGAGGRRYDTLAAESATTVELVSDGPDAGTDPVALR